MFQRWFVAALVVLGCHGLSWQQRSKELHVSVGPDESAPRPHILFILLDDLGWEDASFNRQAPDPGPRTPHMDLLAARGVRLDRHYVHHMCSPTRSAIQSGRAPIHVNVLNLQMRVVNPDDPEGGFAGIPRHMIGMAAVLRRAGYRTHFVGKWDVGSATPDHVPAGRGYDSSFGYFGHSTDCWTRASMEPCQGDLLLDLWEHDESIPFPGRPANNSLNGEGCSYGHQAADDGGPCVYADELFERRVSTIIKKHDPEQPLFLFWSPRAVHGDYQPPMSEISSLHAVLDSDTRTGSRFYAARGYYYGMITWIDGAIGRVVHKMKEHGLYNNTLIVVSSDNGATPGGNNGLLKGSKWSPWEGGIRAASFVSGGFVPESVRGSAQAGLIAAWDWYATFATLAGVDPHDVAAERAGLPPIDSVDVWPLISGAVADSPREMLVLGDVVGGIDNKPNGQTTVGGLMLTENQSLYKLVLGNGPNNTVKCSARGGGPSAQDVNFPDMFFPLGDFCGVTQACGNTPETGCLFDVTKDPSEIDNLANVKPKVFELMLTKIERINSTVYSPNRGAPSREACEIGRDIYRGFWGPFAE